MTPRGIYLLIESFLIVEVPPEISPAALDRYAHIITEYVGLFEHLFYPRPPLVFQKADKK